MKKAITDVETGKTEIVDMTPEEIAAYEKWKESEDAAVAEASKKLEEAEAKREAALAKLAALGLEPDDLKALGL